jgi:hypothetical protein
MGGHGIATPLDDALAYHRTRLCRHANLKAKVIPAGAELLLSYGKGYWQARDEAAAGVEAFNEGEAGEVVVGDGVT